MSKVARPIAETTREALAAIEAWRMRDGGSRGWQSRLAVRAGITPSLLSNILRSNKPVGADVLERLRGANGRDAPTPAMAVTTIDAAIGAIEIGRVDVALALLRAERSRIG